MRSPSCLLWYVACALCDQTEGEVFSELCILLLPVHIINQSSQHLSTHNNSIAQFYSHKETNASAQRTAGIPNLVFISSALTDSVYSI